MIFTMSHDIYFILLSPLEDGAHCREGPALSPRSRAGGNTNQRLMHMYIYIYIYKYIYIYTYIYDMIFKMFWFFVFVFSKIEYLIIFVYCL